MKHFGVGAVVIVSMLMFTSRAKAQTWDDGYPKAGDNKGQIKADANVNLGSGLSTEGTVYVKYWPSGGGAQQSSTFTIKQGQTGMVDTGVLVVSGLTTGQTYNVFVQILAKDGSGGTYYFTTDTKQIKAP